MEGFVLTPTRVHIVRIDPGEDLISAVRDYCKEANVWQAHINGGYGTLDRWHLSNVDEPHFGEGQGDLADLTGLVVDGTPELHATLTSWDRTLSGRLSEGCRSKSYCEIILTEVEGRELTRVDGMLTKY